MIAIAMWSWAFFILCGVIELLLTGAIVCYTYSRGRAA